MTSNDAYSLATTQAVVRALYDEGDRARRKHGDAPLATNAEALSVLMEEVGEVAMALNQNLPKEELKKELVQVASVAVRWLSGDLSFSYKP